MQIDNDSQTKEKHSNQKSHDRNRFETVIRESEFRKSNQAKC